MLSPLTHIIIPSILQRRGVHRAVPPEAADACVGRRRRGSAGMGPGRQVLHCRAQGASPLQRLCTLPVSSNKLLAQTSVALACCGHAVSEACLLSNATDHIASVHLETSLSAKEVTWLTPSKCQEPNRNWTVNPTGPLQRGDIAGAGARQLDAAVGQPRQDGAPVGLAHPRQNRYHSYPRGGGRCAGCILCPNCSFLKNSADQSCMKTLWGGVLPWIHSAA